MYFFSKKNIFFLTTVVCGTIFLSGCGFKSAPPEKYTVKLEVWGVFDDSDAYREIFSEYRKINPYVGEIMYRKLPLETYKEDLLDALAAGKGPDIFMIRNAWRGSFENKIVPAPDIFVTEKQFRDVFVDVAADDFISEGKIYGMPLSVDSLGLYYNKDIFNAAGITSPPATWEELLSDVEKLNSIDGLGNINQSAIALGTAYNINRSTDILTALLFQMGSDIANQTKTGRIELDSQKSQQALEFYTQFARVGSIYYSWNPRLHYSIDAFYEGTLGMMINYSYHSATLKQKNAKLNFGVAPLPQFAGQAPVNVANYWGFAVAKNKVAEDTETQATSRNTAQLDTETKNRLRIHEAWQLLSYMGLSHPGDKITLRNGLAGTSADIPLVNDPTKQYLDKTNKPAARRDLIDSQKNDVLIAPFALGNLIAKNWYQGDPEAVEGIFAEMINEINLGEKSISDALTTARNRVNLLNR